MYLSNSDVVNPRDPLMTPQFKSGNLDPSSDYSSQALYGMSPGSIYAQTATELDQGTCRNKILGACLWVKIKQTGGGIKCKGGGGSCNDWAKLATGSHFCGDCPPSSDEFFCCRAIGSWYFQVIDTPSQPCACGKRCGCDSESEQTVMAYMKVANDCASEDWLLMSPNIPKPIIISGKPYAGSSDENEYLGDLPVGSTIYHVDCDTGALIATYVKLSNACDNVSDWVNTSAKPCRTGAVSPADAEEGHSLFESLECANDGDNYFQTIDTGNKDEDGNAIVCKVLWVKCGDAWEMAATPCIVSGEGPPSGEDLCNLPIGTKYIDTSECKKRVYEKLYNNCDDDDFCPWDVKERFARSSSGLFEFPVPVDAEGPLSFVPDPPGQPSTELEQLGSLSANDYPDDFEFNDDGEICLKDGACPGWFNVVVSVSTDSLGEGDILTSGITLNGIGGGRNTASWTGNPNFPYVSNPFEVPNIWLQPGDCIGAYALANNEGIIVSQAYISVEEVS